MRDDTKFFKVTQKKSEIYTFFSTNEFTFHIWKSSETSFHQHENYIEIIVVLSGTISNKTLENTTILYPGDIILIPPNIPHIQKAITKEEINLLNITCHYTTAEMIFNHLYHRPIPTIFTKKLQKKELSIIKKYKDIILSTTSNSHYNDLITSFCIYLLGLFDTLVNPHALPPEPFQNFLNLLHEMDLEFIKVNDLYKQSGYSQRTLSSYFQKYMNQTLVQYVNSLKLNRAKNLLRSTDLTIMEIATKVGFNSISHFNHLFKKAFKYSPKEYRNKFNS